MSNKTNIKEDKKYIQKTLNNMKIDNEEKFMTAVSNVMFEQNKKIKQYETRMLTINQKSIPCHTLIAKVLDLEEDATIDEIYTAIRILKSKRLNMFEILECNDKAKKYDNLIEKIKEIIERSEKENKPYKEYNKESIMYWTNKGKKSACQELLNTRQEET